MSKIIGIICLFVSFSLQSQIINTESLRMVTDTTGWAGNIGLNVGFAKNVKEIFKIKNDIHIQYKNKKHLIMFINKIGLEKADNADFVNKGVQHLRYDYKINKKLSWEVFAQNQYNAISKIDFRELIGSGVRIKLTKSENYKIYLGSLLMYEFEKAADKFKTKNKDWRSSSYLTFSFYFNNRTSLISTTYYQPIISKFLDYRISHQSAFKFNLSKNLSYKMAFNYIYDEFPVIGIPNQEYEITNGFVYQFK